MTFKELEGFDPDSKVWIFTPNRKFTEEEIILLNKKLADFGQKWVSHSDQLRAACFVAEGTFIILAVDNKVLTASGCSIDSAMRFIQQLQKDFGIELLDRNNFVFINGGENEIVHKSGLRQKAENGIIDEDTLFFDPLIQTYSQLEAEFSKPMKSFWMKNML